MSDTSSGPIGPRPGPVPLEPLNVGAARFRFGPWHDRPDIAYLVPLTPAASLRSDVLVRTRHILDERGFRHLYTAAVGYAERDALVRDGYSVHEELHLLRHDLRSPLPERLPRRARPGLRRGRGRDHGAVLELDHKAFGPFWRLDCNGLEEALRATPISRLRVTDDDARSGYSITGRAGPNGYLQRLAVDPDIQSRGLGTALLADCLHYLRRRHATSVLVNTQLDNDRALDLYERCGFERQSERLSVCQRELP